MKRIGDEIERELGRFGPEAGMSRLVAAWPDAVGEAIARNAWPARVSSDGTLHVATSSAAWAFELSQLAPTVLEQLREIVGAAAPPRLRFTVGRLPEPSAPAEAEGATERVEPSRGELDVAHSFAAAVDNEELRNLLARAAAASLARTRSDR